MDKKNQQNYGLFKFVKKNPSKPVNTLALNKRSIFGDEDDDEEDDESQSMPTQSFHQSSSFKRQATKNITEAIENDPTIFQYDEIYDEIKASDFSNKPKSTTTTQQKPRYINNLLKAAETRKREQEIRFERKIQKEREEEGEEFKDKETFVTGSYRKKLEEMRKIHEEMEHQEKCDNILDVTKQNDLSGFYRSLYRNSMFEDQCEKDAIKEDEKSKITFNKSNQKQQSNLRDRQVFDSMEEDDIQDKKPIEKETQATVERSIEQQPHKEKEISSRTKTDQENNISDRKSSESDELKNLDQPKIEPKTKESNSDAKKTHSNAKKEVEDDTKETEIVKPKLSRAEIITKLFTKRTVGKVFEEARERYFQRRMLAENQT
ncbi:BTB/POZ domain-containing adapter for CUL3-mediated RhoA degradation protein 3 [Sarcoptes scabiei]|nr:BTB/POZ domain-containing adapter for CUL3-mediated RhoA degradation protein 3 [Sarcoptes scabiei]